MKLNMTVEEVKQKFKDLVFWNDIIAWLVEEGLELKPELKPMKNGIYRRKTGTDLIRYTDGVGFVPVRACVPGSFQPYSIDWVLGGTTSTWVLVLDYLHRQVPVDTFEFIANAYGQRIG